MAKRNVTGMVNPQNELTLTDVAQAVERICGMGAVGYGGSMSKRATEEARSIFVRVALRLAVDQALDGNCELPEVGRELRRCVTRQVRADIAEALGVDVNEVFRFHHHAAGARIREAGYREKVKLVERELAM